MKPPFSLPALCISVAVASFQPAVANANALDKSRKIISNTNTTLAKSQRQINVLHDKTQTLLEQYKTSLSEADTYKTYNQQLGDIVQSQQTELSGLEQQIATIDVTSRQIMPLMARMIDTLSEFIAQDLPFLTQEREDRITQLRDNMKRADLSVAEKYRKILESYQIEIDYGKTLETYQGTLQDKQVHFLKIGRTAYTYQSFDGQQYGIWNKHNKQWQSVTDSHMKHAIQTAIRIAKKQQAPELLLLKASTVEAES